MVKFHLLHDTVLGDLKQWDQLQTSYCKAIMKPDPWDERPSAEEHFWHQDPMTSPFCFFPFSLPLLPPPPLLCRFFTHQMRIECLYADLAHSHNLMNGLAFCVTPQPFLSPLYLFFPKPHSFLTHNLNSMTSFGATFDHFLFTAVMHGGRNTVGFR